MNGHRRTTVKSIDTQELGTTQNDCGRNVLIPFVVLSAVGATFLAAGVVGLAVPAVAPSLASPMVAWSLIGFGVVTDVLAFRQLVSRRSPARQ